MTDIIRLTPAAGGDPYNLQDYSVQEDGGNLNASRLDGGVPQITATMTDFPTSSRLMDDLVTISDNLRGDMNGIVRGVSRSSGVINITADHPMALLNTYRSVPPFPATSFATYMSSLLAFLGISLSVYVAPPANTDVFPYPGFTGNVLDQLKALCAARGYVMVPSQPGISIRPARAYTVNEDSLQSTSDALNSQQSAQQVVVNYKQYSSYGTFQAYPPVGSNPADLTPISVNANETLVQTFQMNGTAVSATNPTPVNSITLGSSNQYAVIGNDGLPVTVAQWTAGGGKITARVLPEDSSILEVTVRGASNTSLSPYRIAESSGNNYSALYVDAVGYRMNPSSVTINTGAPANVTSEKVGVTVDNPYIDTAADAYTRGLIVAAEYAGPVYTTNGTASKLTVTPTASEPQFGYIVGSRILRKDVNLIATSTSTNSAQVSYNATLDTIANDFNTVWSGYTFNQYNLQWSGYTFTENTPIPLRRD